jgi:hypothetical protein
MKTCTRAGLRSLRMQRRFLDSVHPSFIEILRQLTPKDAKLLDDLYDSCVKRDEFKVPPWVEFIRHVDGRRLSVEGAHPAEQFEKLVRLGLVERVYELDDSKIEVKFPEGGGGGLLSGVGVIPFPM